MLWRRENGISKYGEASNNVHVVRSSWCDPFFIHTWSNEYGDTQRVDTRYRKCEVLNKFWKKF